MMNYWTYLELTPKSQLTSTPYYRRTIGDTGAFKVGDGSLTFYRSDELDDLGNVKDTNLGVRKCRTMMKKASGDSIPLYT